MNHISKLFLSVSFLVLLFACQDDENNGDVTVKKPTTYQIGDYYKKGKVQGIVVCVDESKQHGTILSLEEGICQWDNRWAAPDYGTVLKNTTQQNMEIIHNLSGWDTIFPVFAWCATLPNDTTNEYDSEWMIPSLEHWNQIRENICGERLYDKEIIDTLNQRIIKYGGTPLTLEYNPEISDIGVLYWSSTEGGGSHSVFTIQIADEGLTGGARNKFFPHRARAIRFF